MNIIFDASILGDSEKSLIYRTGIFRVTESLLNNFLISNQYNLSLFIDTSPETWIGLLKYLNKHPIINTVPIINSKRYSLLHSFSKNTIFEAPPIKELLITKDINHQIKNSKILRRIGRRIFRKANSVLEFYITNGSEFIRNADIYQGTSYKIPSFTTRNHQINNFLIIYDLIPIIFPHFVSKEFHSYFKSFINSIPDNYWLFCISESTKNDLLDLTNIQAERVFVIKLAADEDLFYPCLEEKRLDIARGKYNIPDGQYILSLGSLNPRKNLQLLINSFAELLSEERISDLYLVLVGSLGWDFKVIFDALEDNQSVKNRIIFTGFVDDEDLAPLYSHALAFIFPSFYEGFGLPVLEAMQCGTPVIVSNTSSLPELVENIGIMFDPSDRDNLCQQMLNIYNDRFLRETLSARSIQRAKLFSWEKTIRQIDNAYKFVSNSRSLSSV